MSDTPETDKLLIELGFPDSNSRFAKHAKKMERERNEAIKKLAEKAENAKPSV